MSREMPLSHTYTYDQSFPSNKRTVAAAGGAADRPPGVLRSPPPQAGQRGMPVVGGLFVCCCCFNLVVWAMEGGGVCASFVFFCVARRTAWYACSWVCVLVVCFVAEIA